MSKQMIQAVNIFNQYTGGSGKIFPMIDNYIYLHHTDTMIVIPTYPESIADALAVSYSQTMPIARSAPIFSYSNSGPRSFTVNLTLHRDMMNEVNIGASTLDCPDLNEYDYIDALVAHVQGAALPRYGAGEKMVNPPLISVRFGNDIYCKGVVNGGVTVTYSGPILRNGKYASCNVDFSIFEVDPYDADSLMAVGSSRGVAPTLERNVFTAVGGSAKGTIR